MGIYEDWLDENDPDKFDLGAYDSPPVSEPPARTVEDEAPIDYESWLTENDPEKFAYEPVESMEPPEATAVDRIKDAGIDLFRGAVDLGQSFVGLAKMEPTGMVREAFESIGYDADVTNKFLTDMYSAERKGEEEEFETATGVKETLGTLVSEPALLAGKSLQTLPGMLGIMGASRMMFGKASASAIKAATVKGITDKKVLSKIGQVAGRKAAVLMAPAAEGMQQVGSSFDSLVEEADSLGKAYVASILSGVGTAAIALASGKLASKLKIGDIEAGIAGEGGFLRRVIGGGIQEGPLEELPQGIQEQIWQNWATGRPLEEGVEKTAATGALIGAIMGGGMAAVTGQDAKTDEVAPPPAGEPEMTPEFIRSKFESGEFNAENLEMVKELWPDSPEIIATVDELMAVPAETPETGIPTPVEAEISAPVAAEEAVAVDVEPERVEAVAPKIEEKKPDLPSAEADLVPSEGAVPEKKPKPETVSFKPEGIKTSIDRKTPELAEGEKVVVPAFQSEAGEIIIGEVHADAWDVMTPEEQTGAVEGFKTDKGQFLTSDEAKKIFGTDETNALQEKQFEAAPTELAKKAPAEKAKIAPKKTPGLITTSNKALTEHSIKFDGIQEGFEKIPSLEQYTPQAGPLKGRTFNVPVGSTDAELATKIESMITSDAKLAKKAKVAPSKIVAVAIKTKDGKIHKGKPGQVHATVFEGLPEKDKAEPATLGQGFLDSAGKFMTRDEATAMMGIKRADALNALPPKELAPAANAKAVNKITPGHNIAFDKSETDASGTVKYRFLIQAGPAKGESFFVDATGKKYIKAALDKRLKATEKKVQFATKKAKPSLDNITEADIKSLPFTKKGTVLRHGKGTFSISWPNKRGFFVEKIDSITASELQLKMAYGRKKLKTGTVFTGSYSHSDKTVSLTKYADKWTLGHEYVHFLEQSGLLGKSEVEAVERQSRSWNAIQPQSFYGEEGRARWLTHEMEVREKKRGSPIGKIVQKISDILDSFWNLFQQTARGTVRAVESGAAAARDKTRPATSTPSYEATAQRWRSQMVDFIGEKLPNKGTSKNYADTIKSWAKKGLIKSDELEWSGLIEWLGGQDTLTKANVLAFLQKNNVRVEELLKGGEGPDFKSYLKEVDDQITEEGFYEFDSGTKLKPNPDGGVDYVEELGYHIRSYESTGDAIRSLSGTEVYFDQGQDAIQTKFSQYQLPGGQAYKELLLTLPQRGRESTQFVVEPATNQPGDQWWVTDSMNESDTGRLYDTEQEALRSAKELNTKEGILYRSAHYDEPNILAHIRFNERTGPNGEKVLFLEELQSDYGAEGRKKGFKTGKPKGLRIKSGSEAKGYFEVEDENGVFVTNITEASSPSGLKWDKASVLAEAQRRIDEDTSRTGYETGAVPDAPFVKDTGKWVLLALKRMVRYAAENGFDSVSWTPGSVQFDRWGSEEIAWEKQPNGGWRVFVSEQTGGDAGGVDIENEARIRGLLQEKKMRVTDKDQLKRLVAEVLTRDRSDAEINKIVDRAWDRMQTENIGTSLPRKEGMESFYDKILPAVANKFFNKAAWGKARVGEIRVPTDPYKGYVRYEAGISDIGNPSVFGIKPNGDRVLVEQFGKTKTERVEKEVDTLNSERDIGIPVHSLPITPEMRSKAMREGMPQFATKRILTPEQKAFLEEHFPEKVKTEGVKALRKELGVKETKPEPSKGWRKDLFGAKDKDWLGRVMDSVIDTWNHRYTRIFDRLDPIKTELGDTAYMLHRLETGVPGVMATFMRHGNLEWDGKAMTVKTRHKGFLEWYKKLGSDGENLLYWIAAKRAEQLDTETVTVKGEERTKEQWLTKERRDEIFNDVGQPKGNKSWEQLHSEFNEFNNGILDLAVKAGLINAEKRAQWEQHFYVPFYRIFENADAREEYMRSPGQSWRTVDAGIRRLMGKDQKLGDPLTNIVTNWTHLVSESMRNMSRAEAVDSSNSLGTNVIEEVDKKELTRILGSRTQTRFAATKEGADKASSLFDSKEDAEEWATSRPGKYDIAERKTQVTLFGQMDDWSILSFQRDGERVYFRVNDPELFNAMSGINKQNFDNLIMKAFRTSKQWLTHGATFGPGFRIANMLRDTLHSAIISKSFIPFLDSARGIVKSMREDQDFVKVAASGALFGSSYVQAEDAQALAKFIKRITKTEGRGVLDNILDTPKKLLDFWEKIGSASENAARVSLYVNDIKAQKSHLEAAFTARDILDFTMRGDAGAVQFLIQMVPFMNARMQGLYKLGRAGKADPKSFALKGATLAAASLLLWAANRDDDRWKKLEDWDKWTYYHFWIGQKQYRIPKPFEVGAIFSSLFEAAAETAMGDEEIGFFADFVNATLSETFAFNPTPQLARPIIEQWANKSFFTKRPIESERLKALTPGERKEPWTSKTLQLAGKWGVPPKRAEAIIKGYFSTFGMFILGITDTVTHQFVDFPTDPSLKIDDYPMVGRFIKEARGSRNTKYTTRFYKAMREIDQLVGTVNSYKRIGNFKKARELMEKNRGKLRSKKQMNRFRVALSNLNVRVRRVYASKDHPREKRRKLDVLAEKRNGVTQRAYKLIMSARKRAPVSDQPREPEPKKPLTLRDALKR